MTRTNCLFILLLSLCAGAYAQKSTLHFSTVKLPDDFPVYSIRFIERDEAGLLWLVTGNGLYRFDGSNLLHFDLKSEPALPSFPVTALRADQRGSLWLGFRNGAARFDLRNWKITPIYADDWPRGFPNDKSIESINYTPDGSVYYGSTSGKLYRYQDHRLQLVLDMTEPYGEYGGPSIESVQEPYPGQLWLTTGNGILVHLPVDGSGYGEPVYFKPAELEGRTTRICFGPDGKFLISVRSDGMFLGDTRELLKRWQADSLKLDGPVRRGYLRRVVLPEGDDGNIYSPFYIAAKTGTKVAAILSHDRYSKNIYTFDFSSQDWKLETPARPVNFPGTKINKVSGDRLSTFICSGEGLVSVAFRQSALSSLLTGFNDPNSIRTAYKSEDGALYVSSYRDRFIRYNEITGERTPLSRMYIYSVLPWSRDTLLLATEGDGMQWYLPRENRFVPIVGDGSDSYVTALCRVNDTLVWAGTYEGISLVNPVRRIAYPVLKGPHFSKLQSAKVYAIIPDPGSDGYLAATTAGVFRIDAATGEIGYFIHDSDMLQYTVVYSLLEIDGNVWMGTNGQGVLVSDRAGNLMNTEWLDGRLAGNMAFSLSRVGDIVLAGTDNGMSLIRLRDSSVTTYSVYNGLPAGEFNHSAVFSNGREAYLGTVNGLVHWQGGERYGGDNEYAIGRIPVTRLLTEDKKNVKKNDYRLPYLPSDSIQVVIPPGTGYFSLSFGPATGTERLIPLFYRLDSESNWNEMGNQREINFLKTDPGTYRLEVAARTPGGTWVPGLLNIPLVVEPAFYQTAVFKVLLMLIPVLVVILLFRYRELQLQKERRLRIKIAGDLHDEVGSSLTRIWHQATMGAPLLEAKAEVTTMDLEYDGPEPDTNPLKVISETSREALATMSDIVWSIDARFDTMKDLVLRMKDYTYRLRYELDIPLVFKLNGPYENKKVSQIVRQNLFLLFKEAVNNAIKHGDDGQVSVQMTFVNDHLELQVINSCTENGQKAADTIQGGRGLENMRRRALKMQARLRAGREGDEFRVRVRLVC